MNKKILILITGISLLFPRSVSAGTSADVGTTGAQFLKYGVGARAIGMGGVFCGIADDINALYWNPAGLCRMNGMQLTGSHMMLFQGINYEFGAAGLPIGENMAVAAGASYVSIGDLEARTSDSDDSIKFNASDLAAIGAFSMRMGMFGFGASVKYLYQNVGGGVLSGGDYLADGFAFDAGVHFATEGVEFGKGILAGAVVQNLGSGYNFTGPDDFTGVNNPLPLNIKAGIAYKDVENKLTVGGDVNIPVDNNMNFHFGGEYFLSKIMILRAGFKTTTIIDLGFFSGLSLGAGFNFEKVRIDYAWVPYGVLGFFTHRFSFTFQM